MNKNPITVIGAGITGLTSGLKLLEEGYPVTICANTFTPNTASSGAGAIWMNFKASPWHLVTKWLAQSYKVYERLMNESDAGIELFSYKEFYPNSVDKPCWLKDAGHPYQSIARADIPDAYQCGFEATVFRLDTTLLLPYLQKKFLNLGGKIQQCYFTDLTSKELQVPFIINCTGARSPQLFPDPNTFPIRGQYVIIDKIPGLKTIFVCFLDDERYIAIVPRTNDCWLGGTANPRNWSADIHQDTTHFILENAAKIVPEIKKTQVLDVRVSFRSGRNEIRLEKEILHDGRVVIHNYGHGGSGFSLSFGCAQEVARLVMDAESYKLSRQREK